MTTCCLACGSEKITACLDLGSQPLANDFKKTIDEHEEEYPLAVVRCTECCHLQLDYFIDPDLMFKHYLYISGTSETYIKYLDWFAGYTGVKPGQKVLDVGCNDGTQLDMFKNRGADTWGIDPAENLWNLSSVRHSVTLGYFDGTYEPGVLFDIVNAQNVFAHQRDPLGMLTNMKRLTHMESRIYIQTSQAEMVQNGEFDTIYHEHINFFNTLSFQKLAGRAGLVLTDVIKTPIHGTSYMFVLTHATPPTANVNALMQYESDIGLYSAKLYEYWARNILEFREKLRKRLDGKYVVAYGAAAKGNTLLNFVGIRPEAIVDDNLLKQGRFSPGQRSIVVPKSWIASHSDKSMTFLPLAWNLFDEIRSSILKVRNDPRDEFIDLKEYFSKTL